MWAAIAEALGAPGDVEHLPRDRALRFVADRQLAPRPRQPRADPGRRRGRRPAARGALPASASWPPRGGRCTWSTSTSTRCSPLALPAPTGRDAGARRPGPAAVALFVARARMVATRASRSTRTTSATSSSSAAGSTGCRWRSSWRPRGAGCCARAPCSTGSTTGSASGVTAADRPARQRTLRATIAWSYDLLEPDDQSAFPAAGGVRRVGATSTPSRRSSGRTWRPAGRRGRARRRQPGRRSSTAPDGEPRVGMLQTIRAFARDRLDDSGESDEARLRHARWCVERRRRDRRTAARPDAR